MHAVAGGALYLNNACQQLSASDTFSGNSAHYGGAVAIHDPALDSGRYILSAVSSETASVLRLPCGIDSALANATFRDEHAELSGGAVYVTSTSSVGFLYLPSAMPCLTPCPAYLCLHMHAFLQIQFGLT